MTHTLRRSKRKYARTRRQHKKQRRMRGGFSFTEFIGNFKPKTDAEKCQAAKEAARTACSNNVEGDIEMMPIASSPDSGLSSDSGLSPDSGLSSTASLDEGLSPDSGLSPDVSLDKGLYSAAPIGKESSLSRDAAVVEAPVAPAAAGGGAKKSKKNNKKRRQSRLKKLKSRKHKK